MALAKVTLGVVIRTLFVRDREWMGLPGCIWNARAVLERDKMGSDCNHTAENVASLVEGGEGRSA